MTIEQLDVVVSVFFISMCIFIIIGCCYFILTMWYTNFKWDRQYKRRRLNELHFIEQYKADHKKTNEYLNVYKWKYAHRFKENYVCTKWCRFCNYYVRISDDNEYTKYERGICKCKYKQNNSLNDSIVYRNWSCKYYHGF